MQAPFVMVGLVTLGAVGLAARESAAQPTRPAATQAAQRAPTLREAVQRLQSANPDEVSEAIDALTRIGTPEVVPPLVALIHQGLPDALLETVVSKLGIIGRPEAIEELSALLHHRRPAVRQKAVTALSRIRDPRAAPRPAGVHIVAKMPSWSGMRTKISRVPPPPTARTATSGCPGRPLATIAWVSQRNWSGV